MENNIFNIFRFYINGVVKCFNLLDSWVLVPGVTFLGLLIAVLLLCSFINLIKFGFSDDIQRSISFQNYIGKHEYKGKHNKKN